MPPYNTRSAARKRALAPYENVVVNPPATEKGTRVGWVYSTEKGTPNLSTPEPGPSFGRQVTPDQGESMATVFTPSGTGKGTRNRWIHPSKEETPTLPTSNTPEPGPSFDRQVTPDQDDSEDDESRGSLSTCPTEISDHAELAVAKRMADLLQQQGRHAVERLQYYLSLQAQSDQPVNTGAETQLPPIEPQLPDIEPQLPDIGPQLPDIEPQLPDIGPQLPPIGPQLPPGVTGFGRNGTWLVDDIWQPDAVPSTNQMPTIREHEEGQEEREERVQPVDAVVHRGPGRGRMLGLTPLPSFVTGN